MEMWVVCDKQQFFAPGIGGPESTPEIDEEIERLLWEQGLVKDVEIGDGLIDATKVAVSAQYDDEVWLRLVGQAFENLEVV